MAGSECTKNLNIIRMQKQHILFVFDILSSESNREALHGQNISFEEWNKACLNNFLDPDEASFIITHDDMPVAWLKINGLLSKTAWISMLVVHNVFKRRGIGSYAARFAEGFVCRVLS